MLKGISKILSPELLKILCEMGHSDTLVIADGNFPAQSIGKDSIVLRFDGHGVLEILEAILKIFPLDSYVDFPVSLMKVMEGDKTETPIWETYKKVILKEDIRGASLVKEVDRFEFYEKAKTSYVIIATSETSLYANIILQKGVII